MSDAERYAAAARALIQHGGYADMTLTPTNFLHLLAEVKADALRDAAEALKYPKEGTTYEMWASGVGEWLRSRAALIEDQARSEARDD